MKTKKHLEKRHGKDHPVERLQLESDRTDGQRQSRVEALHLWPMLQDGVTKGVVIIIIILIIIIIIIEVSALQGCSFIESLSCHT